MLKEKSPCVEEILHFRIQNSKFAKSASYSVRVFQDVEVTRKVFQGSSVF